MSPRTNEHMTWHQLHHAVDGVMVHPSDGEAWKHFNNVFWITIKSQSCPLFKKKLSLSGESIDIFFIFFIIKILFCS